jgi:hypothetical protein
MKPDEILYRAAIASGRKPCHSFIQRCGELNGTEAHSVSGLSVEQILARAREASGCAPGQCLIERCAKLSGLDAASTAILTNPNADPRDVQRLHLELIERSRSAV